ncbi:SDR family oxidoreductase [Roseovarius sp. SCSIO 43702]|uniref:SDR family oxidoreductase n=1 Tax=Roseovarius sp. SCSIO 43702 TaxID=2823043 RepID=UPI0021759194|nr:SDR family oxidoreductase [Roseovarius sp. SCSIO 43702]
MSAAGAGIGRASALAMAREGATVHATDIDAGALDTLAQMHENLRCSVLDVTDAGQVAAFAEAAPAPDVLFNCAGFVHDGTILEASDADWERTFALNVRAMGRMIELFLPRMVENGGGSIINMASVASSLKGVTRRCIYSASKGAVLGLTKSVAADFIREGIRCNAICPGTVLTPSLKARMAAGGDYDAAYAAMLDRQPTREMASPEDIAGMVVYLASDESRVATGQGFVVDGGWSL